MFMWSSGLQHHLPVLHPTTGVPILLLGSAATHRATVTVSWNAIYLSNIELTEAAEQNKA